MSMWVVGIMVVAGAYSMYSTYQQGRAQEKMYQAQADQARQEAILKEQQAQDQAELAQDKAKEDSKTLKRQQMKFLASQKANLAAMGISGVSTEDIIADTTMIQEQDKATLRWNADMASWEAITTGTYQSWALNNQAAMADASKYNTRKATNMKMTSTFLSAASSAVGAYSMAGKASNLSSSVSSSGGAGTTTSFNVSSNTGRYVRSVTLR